MPIILGGQENRDNQSWQKFPQSLDNMILIVLAQRETLIIY